MLWQCINSKTVNLYTFHYPVLSSPTTKLKNFAWSLNVTFYKLHKNYLALDFPHMLCYLISCILWGENSWPIWLNRWLLLHILSSARYEPKQARAYNTYRYNRQQVYGRCSMYRIYCIQLFGLRVYGTID